MAGPIRVDPFANFRFRVEIEGIPQAAFMECSGLGSQVAVIEYRDGSDPPEVRKLPGRVSYPDIVLKWGVTASRDLYNWHLAVIQGQIQRKAGSVILVGVDGTDQVRWNFTNAWPSKWDGPTLNAMGNGVAIESLTITCESQQQA
ncbi:MAG TPA: phage tail protein [Candidatus Methylomirabilis sp.]|nr:phage tail protein [Candidatus Methylomirabilis sp.]